MVRLGVARFMARHSSVGRGMARQGMVWLGEAGLKAWRCQARQGSVSVRRGRAQGVAELTRHGSRRSKARYGKAWPGKQ
jgi:hypothetical protein